MLGQTTERLMAGNLPDDSFKANLIRENSCNSCLPGFPSFGVHSRPTSRLFPQLPSLSFSVPLFLESCSRRGSPMLKAASQGEGLGNKFLSHIREVDALVQVVRCFEDADIVHVTGSVDPIRDIEIVTTELVLADLEALRRRRDKISKDVKSGDKHAIAESQALDKIEPHLNSS